MVQRCRFGRRKWTWVGIIKNIMPKYSIVVPLHNEQENVTELYDRLKAVMEVNGESFELVLVDDGSRTALSTCCARLRPWIAG